MMHVHMAYYWHDETNAWEQGWPTLMPLKYDVAPLIPRAAYYANIIVDCELPQSLHEIPWKVTNGDQLL